MTVQLLLSIVINFGTPYIETVEERVSQKEFNSVAECMAYSNIIAKMSGYMNSTNENKTYIYGPAPDNLVIIAECKQT